MSPFVAGDDWRRDRTLTFARTSPPLKFRRPTIKRRDREAPREADPVYAAVSWPPRGHIAVRGFFEHALAHPQLDPYVYFTPRSDKDNDVWASIPRERFVDKLNIKDYDVYCRRRYQLAVGAR